MGFDKLTLVDADGPLWYRGLATMAEDQQPVVDALLRRHGARRIVLGHTPQLMSVTVSAMQIGRGRCERPSLSWRRLPAWQR